MRSLLCTATNATPHKRFLGFNRRSTSGRALPSFLIQTGPVLLRHFIKSKSVPLVEEVELLDANPSFSHVRFANGRELTVSTRDLSPKPVDDSEVTNVKQTITTDPEPENRELSNPCTNNNESLPNMLLIPCPLFLNLFLQLNRPLLDVRLELVKLHRDMGTIYTTRKYFN